MNVQLPFKIIGVGRFLPQNQINSTELEKALQIPKGWSAKYSGVKLRYHASPDESSASMGAKALREALENANLNPQDLNLLISAGATFDYPIPNQASLIKHELGLPDAFDFPCIDLDTTCLSFVSALHYAAMYVQQPGIRNIAIVSAEIASKGLNPECWETATLFGDAAAAAIITKDETGAHGMVKYLIKTYPQNIEAAIIKGGGNRLHIKDYPYDPELHSFKMEGIQLLKMAREKIPIFLETFFENIPINIHEVDWIMPHQASRAGLAILQQIYQLSEKQVCSNLEQQGNCIAASIPSLLYEAIKAGKVQDGHTLLLSGTSAGFSIGGILLKY